MFNGIINDAIMTFVNPNEPVLEVLTQMRNGTLTWASYQDQLAKKGGQGICLKRGAQARKFVDTKSIPGTESTITASADYGTYFLHFELVAAIGFTNTGLYTPPIYGKFHWEGVCKGFDSNTFSFPNNNLFPIPKRITTRVFYSGGSALSIPQLEVNASMNGIVAKASIYY